MEKFVNSLSTVIINPLIYLLFALAAVIFVAGLLQFLANTASDEGREKGKRHMMWGIIGLFIMTAAFAIINVVLRTFGIGTI